MKNFDVPVIYRSPLISAIKRKRKEDDRMKKDFSPTLLDFGPLRVYLARHFGFCYGVENAIEIAFKTIEQNPGKRIFLLSEMIHNPQVNAGLEARGVKFLQDTYGKQLIPFDEISKEDIVLIPAFGTTVAIEQMLKKKGIAVEAYNTTCPFVEKVWNRSNVIARKNYTIVIHGKPNHEETRATFSHAALNAPAVVVRDMNQAVALSKYMKGEKKFAEFYVEFKGQYSEGFNAEKDLERIGVVNQTTMLAGDTQAIADLLKQTLIEKYRLTGSMIDLHIADTKDTLCYATNDNQAAVAGMLETKADLAIVVGGFKSSNTSHLVELCEERLPTFFIDSEEKIISAKSLFHFDLHRREEVLTEGYLPDKQPLSILITSGASCPDALVEGVVARLASFFEVQRTMAEMLDDFTKN